MFMKLHTAEVPMPPHECREKRSFFRVAALSVAAGLGALSSPCAASSMSAGYIQNLSFGSDGYVWFSPTGTRSGALPGCAEPNGLWIINGSTPQGQVVVSALVTAAARHQMIAVQGTGSCDHAHETIGYIVLAD